MRGASSSILLSRLARAAAGLHRLLPGGPARIATVRRPRTGGAVEW